MKSSLGCPCTSVKRKKWFTPRQKQQFLLCRFTKTNVCHCNVTRHTHTHTHMGGGVVPCHWWYIVALERDILLCCRKQMDNPFSATVWRLKFKSNATFKQMSEYKIKTVLSMPGFKQRKSTVWHLGVIFSLRVFMPSYKINLVIVRGKKNSKNLHVNPRYTNKSFFFALTLHPTPS